MKYWKVFTKSDARYLTLAIFLRKMAKAAKSVPHSHKILGRNKNTMKVGKVINK